MSHATTAAAAGGASAAPFAPPPSESRSSSSSSPPPSSLPKASKGKLSTKPSTLVHPIEDKQLHRGDIVRQLSCSLSSVPASIPGPIVVDGPAIPSLSTKGRNASGRTWKVRPQKRASTLIKSRVNGSAKDWEARQAERRALQEAKELQAQLQEEKRQQAILKKERKLEQEKRRAENELKSLERNAQALNPARAAQTLKSLSKKQLRQVKKTRLNPRTGVVEYVPAYAK